jgi:hypothetical protein
VAIRRPRLARRRHPNRTSATRWPLKPHPARLSHPSPPGHIHAARRQLSAADLGCSGFTHRFEIWKRFGHSPFDEMRGCPLVVGQLLAFRCSYFSRPDSPLLVGLGEDLQAGVFLFLPAWKSVAVAVAPIRPAGAAFAVAGAAQRIGLRAPATFPTSRSPRQSRPRAAAVDCTGGRGVGRHAKPAGAPEME